MPTVLDSLNAALRQALAGNPNVILLGEDILDPYGGAFRVTQGLSSDFPNRVLTTPISEAGMVGLATGMALRGFRPVVEIMFGDFVTLIADQVINHAAKFRWMYNDQVRVPLVIRTPMGGRRGYGPTHSQTLEKLFLGVPGLRVLAPCALGAPGSLLKQAILEDDDPVLFVENKLLYPLKVQDLTKLDEFEFSFVGNPNSDNAIERGVVYNEAIPRIGSWDCFAKNARNDNLKDIGNDYEQNTRYDSRSDKESRDRNVSSVILKASYAPTYILRLRGAPLPSLTLATYGYMAELARQAALSLAYEHEVFVELVISTQLAPFAIDPILASTRRTGKLLTVEEGAHDLGWGAEVLAMAVEALGPRLRIARRLAAHNLPIPASGPLEAGILPSMEQIVETCLDINRIKIVS
jgi:pyruvate/2-oxoglutarate/acetoin dehydrogenase E1 component